VRRLTLLIAGVLPATLFLDWFEVYRWPCAYPHADGCGESGTLGFDLVRFSGWESFQRTDLILVALCVGLAACEVIPRRRGIDLARVLLAGTLVAVIAAELVSPPAGSEVTTALFGGAVALVMACALLASSVAAALPRLTAASRVERWALLLFPSALLAVLGWMQRWSADDAFINFRVVDHILAGNGPVFNTGERIEVYTSTLWLAVLTALHGLLSFVALEWIAVVLGLALAVAGLVAATVGARLLHRGGLRIGPAGRGAGFRGAAADVGLRHLRARDRAVVYVARWRLPSPRGRRAQRNLGSSPRPPPEPARPARRGDRARATRAA